MKKKTTTKIVTISTVLLGLGSVLTTGALRAAPPTAPPPPVEQIETSKIKDLTATLRVDSEHTDYNELKKIGGAFATTYRVKRMEVSYKYPNKARFQGLNGAVYIIFNGDQKKFKIPMSTKVMDVSHQPGQKQSLLDLGIFATDYLTTDYQPQFVKRDGALLVYKLVQRNTDNKTHEMVWVNPKTSIIERRQSINGDNVFQKEIKYLEPRQIRPGIWVPTRIEIYNQYGKRGAVQFIEDIKVNLGVDDQQFAIS